MTPRPSNPHLTLHTPTASTLPSLQRLNTLLLPVSYPAIFYSQVLSDPVTARLTKLLYYDSTPIAGVRCRLENSLTVSAANPPDPETKTEAENENVEAKTKVYIMTLCTLSPYRRLGAGSLLLDSILSEAVDLGATEVYAHVWEANDGALEWYAKRGFTVGALVEGYYRRLKPAGARVVVRTVGIGDFLRVKGVSGPGEVEEEEEEGSGK
ncbi:hypothetical protein RUND412_007118 [Rhizina undulata]